MKKSLLFLLFVAINLCCYADRDEIRLNTPGQQDDRYDFFAHSDEPDVYYDSDDQVIIIDGSGYVSYYDVVIESATSWTVMISTQVSGSYDTIDISSLPSGMYCITIDSPAGNSYEGFFDTY